MVPTEEWGTTKELHLSPTNLETAEWSMDEFFRQVVMKERFDGNAHTYWGSFCHSFTELSPLEREKFKPSITPKFRGYLEEVAGALIEYDTEIPYKREFYVDDWKITLNYRLDRIHPVTGHVVELKFPLTKAWTKGRVHNSVKNAAYKMFHPDFELWCVMEECGIKKIPFVMDQKLAEEKVHSTIRKIIGRVSLLYF